MMHGQKTTKLKKASKILMSHSLSVGTSSAVLLKKPFYEE
jgi:hypothetical protein